MTYVINFTTDFENLTTQKVISTKLLTLSNNNYFFFNFRSVTRIVLAQILQRYSFKLVYNEERHIQLMNLSRFQGLGPAKILYNYSTFMTNPNITNEHSELILRNSNLKNNKIYTFITNCFKVKNFKGEITFVFMIS